ncbi:allatostatin-A receptor-like [Actinia tenebrosa]|uniref:Allatostatin-A receptor-like n=1 Tax=Actinia tenebrosa TaxID=6105 RepID=A0A6P8IPY7_ACTTE|nr:allatostatin-A receptor-like [Actinia tenebrosa]
MDKSKKVEFNISFHRMDTKSLLSGDTLEPFLNQSSGNLTEDKKANLDNVNVFQVVILSLILIAGFVGNILVVGVVALKCEMRTRTNIFFTNLAIAEIGTCVFCVPLMLMGLTRGRWNWGNEFCKVNCFMLQFWFLECVFTLIALSLHKYLSVYKPLKRIMNRKRTFLVILCTWMIAFLCATGPVLGWKKISNQSEAATCYFNNPTRTLHFAHVIFFSTISYMIPIIAIIIIYYNVIRVVQKHFKRIRDTGIIDDKGIRAKRRIVITISIVIFVFFLCWTPFFVNSVMSLLNVQRDFFRVALFCGFSFSVFSPVILVMRNPRFKRGFGEILTCGFFREGSQIDLGTSFGSNISHTNPSFEYIEERRCSAWYMSTQKNLLSLEPAPPERRLKLRWIETNL